MKLSPRLRTLARWTKTALTGSEGFRSSAEYWEDRYRRGGNSGSGSYGRLAEFKSQVLNEFVSANSIQSVIEFGSGDGALLCLTNFPQYTGVDVSPSVLESTRLKFKDCSNMRFIHTSEFSSADRADLALSLDVIYHLVEDEVFDSYMRQLFDAAIRFVVIYSSDRDRPNPGQHVRERQFTGWVAANQKNFKLVRRIENPYPYSEQDPDQTTWSDFFIFERTAD